MGIVFALITLGDKNSSIDDVVRAQGAPLVTVFSDDFSTDPNTSGKWRIVNRFAGDLDKEVVWDLDAKTAFLTKASDAKAGVMVADYQLTSKLWEATFRFRAGGGEDPLFLGEGFVFHFYKNVDTYLTHRPMAAGALGFEGVPPGDSTCAQGVNCVLIEGYGIAFDAFPNGTPMIQVIKNRADPGAVLHQVGDTRVLDNAWHDARISFNDGMLSVAIDGGNVFSHTIASMDYAFSGIAFSAATGLADQNHVIDDFVLRAVPVPTPTPTSVYFKQGNPPFPPTDTIPDPIWEDDEYDHAIALGNSCDGGTRMRHCGCVVTSAAMLLLYHQIAILPNGEAITPRTLNNYLKSPVPLKPDLSPYVTRGFTKGQLDWLYLAALSNEIHEFTMESSPKIEYTGEVTTTLALQTEVDSDRPAFVKVGNLDSHYVLARRYTGTTFEISDPGAWLPDRSTLAAAPYNNMLKLARTYAKTNSDFSGISVVSSNPVHLLIVDPIGRRTGYDFNTGLKVLDIPLSEYVLEETYADTTGEYAPDSSMNGQNTLIVRKPLPGSYALEIYAQPDADYFVAIRGFDRDGSQAPAVLRGTATMATTQVTFDYDSHPGSTILQLQDQVLESVGGSALGSISLSPSAAINRGRTVSSPTVHHAASADAPQPPTGVSISWAYLALLAVIVLIVSACTLRRGAPSSQSNLNDS
ncbi:MAG: hypothetical protein IPJ58_19185 [Ardenticatenia bacterium]|nr:hypothetical protein [Ardenticatenia bacterium]